MIIVAWKQISVKQGTEGQRVRQGGQGQTEGCWRCDGNRNGLLGQAEDDRAGQTCQRSIGDQYLTLCPFMPW